MLTLILATACGTANEAGEPAADTSATLPAPVVTTEATNTFIPYIEVQPSPTASATPTLEPPATATATPTTTPTPLSPVAAIALEPVISEGLSQPTFLTHAFDDRLFVVEQAGLIRIIENGQLLETPFLDVTGRVGSLSSEPGLLGLAFHPNYATHGAPGEGTFYVNYTDLGGDTHVARFSVLPGDPNRADPESEVQYLFVDQPFPNHNGGMVAFGPDGYLYVGMGDGGSANDPLNAGQDRMNLLGKILRLDVDTAADAYTIPESNPFAGASAALSEIWAYGVRNPWRFSFDRASGDLYMADVGQNEWEEVNFQPAASAGGENYGWRIMEGTHCFQTDPCNQGGLESPIFEYNHAEGCSITGGYVYRGALHPGLTGNYFVADFCMGTIWRLLPQENRWLADVVLESDLIISSFGEGVNGELYVLNYGTGGVYRIVPGSAPN